MPSDRSNMSDGLDPAALLIAHRKWIEKVAQITCRRNSVWGDEAEDFASLAVTKMIENDYAVLRKFRGDSDIKTYLATVVIRRFQEYARERWGRWRYSARAEALGQTAKDLEMLVYRDGHSLNEAIELLRTSGRSSASTGELTRLFTQLPLRTPRPEAVGSPLMDVVPGGERADTRVLAAEAEERCRQVMEVLHRALSRLDPDDQVLVRGRFGEGHSVADIARALQCEQAPLYRRSERLCHEVRGFMEAAGVSRDDVAACLELHEG